MTLGEKFLTGGFFLLLGLVVLLILSPVFVVEAGEVAVISRFGEIQERTYQPGLHFKIPIVDNIKTYNVKKITYETAEASEQKTSKADYKDYSVDTTTNDGQKISLEYTVRFSVNPERVIWVANNIGVEESLVEKVVKTESRIWARNIPRGYDAEDLYTGNVQEVSQKIEDKLRPKFEDNGLRLDVFGIRDIEFSEDYVEAVEDKRIEAEKIITQKNIAEQEKYKKEARITRAEGEAKEQELQKRTLTETLLKKMYVEKWNGQLPEVMCGEGQNMILDIGQ